MTNRKLTRQIRRLQRLAEKLRKQRIALRRMKRRLQARIARERTRVEREIERKRRNAEKARKRGRRATDKRRKQRVRERRTQERENMKMEMKERCKAAESRSERSSRLIRLGGLVVIAGLPGIGEKKLERDLKWIRSQPEFAECREIWRKKGRRIAAEWEATGRDATMPDLAQVSTSDSPKRAFGKRTHQLATMGGVIDKAGLGHEDAMVVLGILVAIAEHEAGRDWTQLSPIGVTLEAVGADRVAEPLRLAFPRPIARSLGSGLQDLGLAYLADNQGWFGAADRSAVEALAGPWGGAVAPWPSDSPEIRTALAFVQRRRERTSSAPKTQGNPATPASRGKSQEKR